MKLTPGFVTAPLVAAFFALAFFAATPISMSAQQAGSNAVAAKPIIEEWVYRTKYGFKDEWWTIFKKYQIAILERQKELGYVREFTVYAPSLHTGEDSRWDYRVIIVLASADAPPANRKVRSPRNFLPIKKRSSAKRTVDGS